MKTYIRQTMILLLILTFFSCGNDDNIESINQSPEDFSVIATADIKGLGVSLSWEIPIDTDGDALIYDVMVGTTLIAENITTPAHLFLASAYNTMVSGNVIAKDGKGGERSVPFNVTSSSLVNIPDQNFEALLVDGNIDLDGQINGQMDYQQALEFTILDISGVLPSINDLTGIESFANLEYFDFSNQAISNLDLNRNTKLEKLLCSNTDLTSLDISNNIKLKSYIGAANNITSIDFSKNVELTEISVEGNELLTELDITKNTELTGLNCGGTSLTSINVSNNTKLKALLCYESAFTILDLSNNPLLETLACAANNITSLDLNTNVNLKSLNCGQNNISILNLSQNSQLQFVFCSNNDLTSLNVKNGTSQNIQNFNAKNNPNLTSVCIDILVPVSPVLSGGVDSGVSFSTICN